ncbi:hypothetical protein AB1I68_00690 [Paenibacillus pabuli]
MDEEWTYEKECYLWIGSYSDHFIVGISWYFIPQWYDKEALEAGTFGDMFGAVNALFSGLAFAGLIYTITVQRQELSLQREAIEMQTEELRMQREETARSADQLEGQRMLLNLQIAMATINELIKNKNERLEGASIDLHGTPYKGINGLRVILRERKEVIDDSLKVDFEYYLNPFIYILQYIDDADLTSEQKNSLAKLLDTNTSNVEVYMLYKVFNNDQHQLALLKRFNFDERYDRITKK